MNYVTYHDDEGKKAIGCPSEDSLQWTFLKVLSSIGTKFVRLNRCGRLPKDTKVMMLKDVLKKK